MRAIPRWYKQHNNNNTSAKHFTLEHAGHGDACVRRQASTASIGARVAEMSNAVSGSTDGSDEKCECVWRLLGVVAYGSPPSSPADRRGKRCGRWLMATCTGVRCSSCRCGIDLPGSDFWHRGSKVWRRLLREAHRPAVSASASASASGTQHRQQQHEPCMHVTIYQRAAVQLMPCPNGGHVQ